MLAVLKYVVMTEQEPPTPQLFTSNLQYITQMRAQREFPILLLCGLTSLLTRFQLLLRS